MEISISSPTVKQVSDLRSLIALAKSAGENFGTNLFLTDACLEPLVQYGRLSALESPGAVVFLKHETLFDRMYFAAASTTALGTALRQLYPPDHGTLVADLVGRRSEIEPWVSQFQDAGFTLYSTILRMFLVLSKRPHLKDPDPAIEAANERDAPAILAMLKAGFDPYADQLPEIDDIARAAADGTILVTRDAERLTALLYYDICGLTTRHRFWFILPEYRNKGLNFKLMDRYFHDCARCRRAVLWVHESNHGATLIYKRYGYQFDSVVDFVLVKR